MSAPSGWIEVAVGGLATWLRRAGPGDGPAVLELYESLGDTSRYARFGQATPRLTATLRRSLTDFGPDPLWLAFDGASAGRCVGEARVVRSRHGGPAELAITVADAHQGHGLGAVLGALALADADAGPITVTIAADNGPARRLAARAGVALRWQDGAHVGRVRQGPPHPYDLGCAS